MPRSAVRRRSPVSATDEVLVREAAAGGVEAFGELYRRHSPAAWGVAQAIVHNPDDASDAVAEAFTKVLKTMVGGKDAGDGEALRFRPYLLTATRHAALDLVRKRSRLDAGEAVDEAVVAGSRHGQPAEHVVAREEEAIVVAAFGRLPERWRTALWLIDVEELSTRDAAAVLGVEPNNAAQLAARARARLREQYLQAHVPNHIRPRCEEVVSSLGSYLAGTASASRRGHVDEHLAACPECNERLAHVRDLGITLRRAILPVPLLLDRRVSRSVSEALDAAASLAQAPATSVATMGGTVPVDAWGSLVQHLSAASPLVERVVAGVSAAAFVVGVSTAAIKSHDGTGSVRDGASMSSPAQGGGAITSPAAFPAPISTAGTGRAVTWGPAEAAASAVTGAPGPRAGEPHGGEPAGLTTALGAVAAPVAAAVAAPVAAAVAAPVLGAVAAPVLGAVAAPVAAAAAPVAAATQAVLGPTLRGADLAGADLTQAVARGMDFTGANLGGARLSGTDVSGSVLRDATLTGADLTKAVLTGADLQGADLRQVTLTGADLTKAVLTGADLRGADLRGAKLAGAVLTAADLRGADLEGADVTGTVVRKLNGSEGTLAGSLVSGTALDAAARTLPPPDSALAAVPRLPVPVPTALPASAPVLSPLAGGVPVPTGAAPGGLAGGVPLPAAVPAPAETVTSTVTAPLAAHPGGGATGGAATPGGPAPSATSATPKGSGGSGGTAPPLAPLLGGPLLPGAGGILGNSPLSPLGG